jgi:membrane dipeptidase
VVFNFQGTDPLEGSLELVEAYYALGVRHMGLAYNLRNRVGDGCFEPNDAGLSLFGRKLIAQMNRCGMLIDGSHAGVRTSLHAMELSSAPVIFSHANPAGLCPHPRNLSDEQIRACAATGGVVGILGISNMLGTDGDVSPERIATHVDYCVQLVGIEHVGLAVGTCTGGRRTAEVGQLSGRYAARGAGVLPRDNAGTARTRLHTGTGARRVG